MGKHWTDPVKRERDDHSIFPRKLRFHLACGLLYVKDECDQMVEQARLLMRSRVKLIKDAMKWKHKN